jgi:hypothetical protein
MVYPVIRSSLHVEPISVNQAFLTPYRLFVTKIREFRNCDNGA